MNGEASFHPQQPLKTVRAILGHWNLPTTIDTHRHASRSDAFPDDRPGLPVSPSEETDAIDIGRFYLFSVDGTETSL
jgi:hypothetical protein